MRAAAYARYSSDNQREESIEEQLREIREYANKKGYTIVKEYCDYAISGASLDRPQFELMLRESSLGLFDVVLVFDYTRFSRGGERGLIDEMTLTKNGVILVSITEDYGSGFGAKLIKHVKFLMAEEDLQKLRINVARGQKDNALKCLHNGGTPPLGYDVDPQTKKYVINEHEAKAVRIIFEMFAEGHTYREIIAKLNSLGYKTKRNNKEFQKNSLHGILTNKKYIGIFEYGKIKRGKPNNPKYKSSIIKQLEPIIIENGIPAIIDKELWDRAQVNVKKREPSKRAKVDYMLTNKFYCGYCGSRMVGSARGSSKKKPYNVYICSNRANQKGCKNRSIKKEVIEEKILKFIWDDVLSEKGLDWIIKKLEEYNQSAAQQLTEDEKKQISAQIKKLEQKQNRLKEAYLEGIIELQDFKTEKKNIEFEIEFLKSEMKTREPVEIDREKIKTKLEQIKSEILDDKALINTIIEKVIIKDEEVEIHIFSYYGLA